MTLSTIRKEDYKLVALRILIATYIRSYLPGGPPKRIERKIPSDGPSMSLRTLSQSKLHS